MKKLKSNQRGPWCSFCPPKAVRAVYRQDGFSGLFACAECKDILLQEELKIQQADSRLTEADYQSWY